MNVQDQAQADRLNRTGMTDPYQAANWHIMIAPVDNPKDEAGNERDYRIGDRILYRSYEAECHQSCNHDSPPPDW